ncbi:MAG: hypothetical protein IPL83_02475 [Bdellovibrionales bacterium]|nr:hypothetical protein [Bdellovibrionales bacterium]
MNSFTTAVCILFSIAAAATPPDWTRQNGIQQRASILTVVTNGIGPSLDLARRSAIDQAKGTAAEQINGSANIRSMSIETEKTASFHSEVSSTKNVEGLICNPLNEYNEEKEGVYTVWLKCSFDTKKIRVQVINETEVPQGNKNSVASDESSVKSIEVVDRSAPSSGPTASKISYGENRHFLLSVVPSCESILVRGKQSRTIHCKGNPVTVLVLPTDTEIIIRGPSGFAPKHLKVHGKQSGSESIETMEVYLEKM